MAQNAYHVQHSSLVRGLCALILFEAVTVVSSTCACGEAAGDPHLTLAHNGKADFRGSDKDSYVFLSSAGYQFAPGFQAVSYHYTNTYGVGQLVHGTFITRGHWVITTAANNTLTIGMDAVRAGQLNVTINGIPTHVPRWSNLTVDEVKLETRFLTVSVMSPEWTVTATSKPIYGQLNEWWHGMLKRFDISIKGAFPQPDAHGIIGQSYSSSIVRNGKQDDYEIPMSRVTDDGQAPSMTTEAQAEGAIDGVYTDYLLTSPYSTSFKYSAYQLARQSLKGTSIQEASVTEKGQPEGMAANEAEAKAAYDPETGRRLSTCSCGGGTARTVPTADAEFDFDDSQNMGTNKGTSGTAMDMTLYGTPTDHSYITAGKVGGALRFTGGHATLPTGYTSPTLGWTLCAWLRKVSTPDRSNGPIFDFRDSHCQFTEGCMGLEFQFGIRGSGDPHSFSSAAFFSTYPFPWDHLCIVSHASDANGEFYLNGVLDETYTGSSRMGGTIYIAGRQPPSGLVVETMDVDNVQFYRSELTSSQIADLYTFTASNSF